MTEPLILPAAPPLPVTDATVAAALPAICARLTLSSYLLVLAAVVVMLMDKPLLMSAGLWLLATVCWWGCKKKSQSVRFNQWSAHLAPLGQVDALAILDRPDLPVSDSTLVTQWLNAYRSDWVSAKEVLPEKHAPDGQPHAIESDQRSNQNPPPNL